MVNTQITTATNTAGPDLSLKSAQADARKYFNNFYSGFFNVSGNTNDAIVSFFQEYAQNATAAQNLAAAVIYTAEAQNVDPLVILSDFQKLPKGQLNSYLVAFLNISRAPTSVLGLKDSTKTSPFITRTILL
jgi:hypothetical protein